MCWVCVDGSGWLTDDPGAYTQRGDYVSSPLCTLVGDGTFLLNHAITVKRIRFSIAFALPGFILSEQ